MKSIHEVDSKKMNSQGHEQVNYFDPQMDNSDHQIIEKQIDCTEYAPDVFEHLRSLDGIIKEDLRTSLNPDLDKNVKRIEKAGEGMGKSGSFFFFSHDD